ncbi:protein kinase domain-containing protein [Caldithrix abyssi]
MLKSIGNYEIIKIIAEHGPTTICLARHKKLKRKTFLKIFKSADPSLLQRFEREAQIVADLNDRQIVAIYDFGEENGLYYISMEYVEGGNLKEFLERTPLSAPEILDLAYKIARAVAVLHQNNYIHRDLKPENILIDEERNVKLTDFGIAYHKSLHRMTMEGSLLGTPLYMSPEQINNLPVTPASDVFSLGIIYYQMITGQHPFEAPRIGEIFSQILTKPVDDLKKLKTDLPDWFVDLVLRMLNKETGGRPQSAVDVLKEFERHLKTESPKKEEITVDEESAYNKPIMIVSFAFLALILLFAWWFTRENKIPDSTNNLSQHPAPVIDSLPPLDSAALRQRAPQNNQPQSEANVKEARSVIPATTPPQNNEQVNAQATGDVIIKTIPWCRIYLDYQLVDSTPMLKPLKLKAGTYTLGLQNPSYPIYTQTIEIKAGKINQFEFILDSLFSRLDLHVLPWGDVYIDGKYIGKTPLQKPIYVTREKHVLEIRNEYYGSYVDTIDFSAKARIRRQIALQDLKNNP